MLYHPMIPLLSWQQGPVAFDTRPGTVTLGPKQLEHNHASGTVSTVQLNALLQT